MGFTGVEEGDGVVDGFFGMCFEDIFHVWEGRIPFQCVAEISVCAHYAEVAARRNDLRMQGFADLIGQK